MQHKGSHHDDQTQAATEHRARQLLAETLGLPERHPSSIRLVEGYAARTGNSSEEGRAVASAALTLLAAARAELEALEAGVLFAARASGLTWAEMASPMGLGSPQAVQQRLERINTRAGSR